MLCKKAKYAIKALRALADAAHAQPVRIADLAREQIPRSSSSSSSSVIGIMAFSRGGRARAQYKRLGVIKGQRVFVSATSVRVFAQPEDGRPSRIA